MKPIVKNTEFKERLAARDADEKLAVGGSLPTKGRAAQHKKDKETVRRGIASFVETGAALARIRDARSFEEDGYDDFETFCTVEYEFTPQYGNRLIVESETFLALSAKSQKQIVSGNAAFELSKIPEEKREDVIEKAEKKSGKASGSAIRKAAEPAKAVAPVQTKSTSAKETASKAKIEDAEFTEVKAKDPNGIEIPTLLLPEWSKWQELAKDLKLHVNVLRGELKAGTPFGALPKNVRTTLGDIYANLQL